MTPRSARFLTLALGVAMAAAYTGSARAADKGTILLGMQCDRTGPTQVVGTALCPGTHDYIDMINAQGGVDGWKIEADEVDNAYTVPPAIAEYERAKQQGAVGVMVYGTPQTEALNQRLEQDKIPGTSPGFGIAASADGKYYPYLFPIAANYWSQGAAAVQFAKQQLGGSLKGKKIAYIFYDNPAGHEPLPVVEQLSKDEGFTLQTFAVPPPGVDVSSQVLAIAQQFRPDFVIDHTFGKSPALVIKGLQQNGYPLDKVVALVWASGEADILGAGGWKVAQGYNTMQFAGAGENYPVINEIKAFYKKAGKAPPATMASTVYYNRGVFQAAVWVAAVKNALKLSNGKKPTPTDVAKGFEMIKDFKLGGLVPPITISPTDHEGGGWVRIFQVKGEAFVPKTDWFRGYRDLVVAKEAKIAEQMAQKSN
ncbi:MAG TPA: ABC transporter substrate-binding protein [Stellaceae bacterium]|nr:ABC transporter substrate-binding protein [Stellaceae bacterium]